jgi:hypothetical protein
LLRNDLGPVGQNFTQDDYGIEVENPTSVVVFDAASPEQTVAKVIAPEIGFKRGRHTFTQPASEL